jgi:excisionase family DNA binding protein
MAMVSVTDKGLYTVEEASEYLAQSRAKIFEFIACGQLESVKIGRSRRIPHAALVTFIETLRRKSGQ